ncbi:MAG: MFS transporter [Caldilineaceae bacterium]|nr:MFS transporter [Caldilineaceae bacterium]
MTKLFVRTPAAGSALLPIYWAGLGHFTLELCHNFMPVLYPLLTLQMGLSFTQIGLLALANNLITASFQPLLGFLPERFGAERVVAFSILWLGVLMGLVGFAPNFFVLTLLVALASFGSAAYHPAGVVNVTHQNRVRRGTAMAIFSVGGSLGAAVSPTWLLLWLDNLGVRSSLMIIPIALVVSALFLHLARNPLPLPTKTQSVIATTIPKSYLFGMAFLVLGTMARAWFQVAFVTYLPAWVQGNGGSLEQGGQLLSIFLFATGAGSLLGGMLADRIGVWTVAILTNLMIAPAFWLWLGATPLVQLFALIVIGFALGANYPTVILLAHDAWPQRIALASGLVMGFGWVPAGLGASFTGYLADQSSLTTAMTALLAPAVLAVFCVLAYRLGAPKRTQAEG